MSYRLENIVYLENEQYFFYFEYFIYKSESIHEIFVIVYVWGGALGKRNLFFYNEKLCLSERKREREKSWALKVNSSDE